MKKILFMHAGAELYGADRILINLVTELDKNKYIPIVVLPSEGPLVSELKKRDVKTFVISYPVLRRRYFNLKGITHYVRDYKSSCRKIYSLLKKENIEIIHINTLAVLEGIYLKSLFGSKLVWHVHEIITHPKIAYLATSFLVGRFANQIVAVSEQVKSHLVKSKLVPSYKIEVIYNGIDTKKFKPHAISPSLQREFSIKRNDVTIGMVGRLNAWKGQSTMLESVLPLVKECKNLKIIFVGGVFQGEDIYRENLIKKINSSGNADQIMVKDFRSDIKDVYQLIDVFCLPSTSPDPLPTVVLEAMASGKPIIGFNHGGIKEMVVNGTNGYLVPPIDVNQMTIELKKLLDNQKLRQDMGRASRDRAIKLFSPEKFISEFEKIYSAI